MGPMDHGWGPPWPPPQPPWGRPAGPSVWWAVVLWGVAAICLAGTLLFGVLAATGFWLDNRLDNHGVTTSATVTEVDGSTVTVEFTTEDNYRATADFTWWPDEYPAIDDQIQITYDPDDPSYVTQAGSDEDQLMATGFAVAALGALSVAGAAGVGAVLIHHARGRAARFNGY
jgi:uncharacterized protein DUF3592